MRSQARQVHAARLARVTELFEAIGEHGSDVAAMGLLWLVPILALLVALFRS